MKTSELIGPALDWAVAKCEGISVATYGGVVRLNEDDGKSVFGPELKFSTDWSQGGPIIEREGIEIRKGNPLYFPQGNERGDYYEPLWLAGKQHGTTALIAAMRCYVALKLGDEVDIPEALL